MTELIDKAIDIKGKQYVLVSDRVIYFNETYQNGCIITERLSQGDMQIGDMEIFKATVIPDVDKPERKFTGYSQAKRAEDKGKKDVNIGAAMENAETSAVGRALAMMGIGVIDSIASADEMKKAGADKEEPKEEKKDKPRFNKPELDNFSKKAGEYGSFEEGIKEIKKYYQISKAMEENVRKLYESLETIKK